MSEPVWHRIHPLTIVIALSRALRQLFIAVVFIVYSYFSGGAAGSSFEIIIAILGLLVVVPAVLNYYFFGYAIHQGKLLVKSGVVTKNLRTIPLDRIQNINLTRNLLHRMLGLVDLEIETASSAKAEASISALSEDQARILKAQLLRETPKITSFVHEDRDKVVIYKPTNWEIFLAGASENRLLAIVAAIMGLGFFGNAFENFIERNSQNIGQVTGQFSRSWVTGAALLAGLFLFGWVVSIVSTFIQYYGFELTDEGKGRLKRSYGLLNHIENVLPLRRIQTVVFRQNIIQRWLKICKLYVSTAGGFGNQQKGDGSVEVPQSPLLTPVLRMESFPVIGQTVLPSAAVVEPEWNPVAKATILRHIRSSIVLALILGTGAGFWVAFDGTWRFGWQIVAAFFTIVALFAWSGYVHYKFAKWADVENVVVSRVGWLSQRRNYLPTDKVQAVTVRQSPVQRAFKLATVELASAAPTFQTTEIDDVPAEVAAQIAESVHHRSAQGRDTLVDGF